MTEADLVLHGGNVVTLDGESRIASAVAVAGERILAVGEDRDIRAFAGPATSTFDLAGRTVLPGINDAHLHLAMFGLSGYAVDLNGIDSLAALHIALLGAGPGPGGGDWLVGAGWREAT